MLGSAYWVNKDNSDQLLAPWGVRKGCVFICLDEENQAD